MEHWWDDDDDGKAKHTLRKTCFIAVLSTINLTWAMGLNLGLCSEMVTTNHLSKMLWFLMKDTKQI
jgi:hypothetical protein